MIPSCFSRRQCVRRDRTQEHRDHDMDKEKDGGMRILVKTSLLNAYPLNLLSEHSDLWSPRTEEWREAGPILLADEQRHIAEVRVQRHDCVRMCADRISALCC